MIRRIRTTTRALLAVLALSLAIAPLAHANAFEDVFKAYAKTGKVDPCKFSPSKLKSAKKQVPKDIEQYAPDLPAAIDAAIQARASGACKKSAAGGGASPSGTTTPGSAIPGVTSSTPTTSTPTTSTPAASTPTTSTPGATPAPAPTSDPAPAVNDDAIPAAAIDSSKDDGGTAPAPLILLAVFGGLMLLGAIFYLMTRYLAIDPPWLQRVRHSTSEVGWRASAAWAEFTDWLRFGR